MHRPTTAHWKNVKHILHYLKGTISHSLLIYKGSLSILPDFSNADWARNVDDWRFVSSFTIFLGPNLIS